MLVDSHCHLADAAFAGDLDDVVARARAAGLVRALCILSADEPDEVARAAVVRAAWADVVFAAAIHPHRAAPYAGRAADAADLTRAAVVESGAKAVGEIGLDYHYDFAPRDVQRDVFAAQASLAAELRLPIVVHTREAFDDTLDVLRALDPGPVTGVMHCFTGTAAEARRALDLGLYISLSGIVTFPNAAELREVARLVPDDRLLMETDAPFLAPVPHRGKRNEPAFVAATLAALAAARGRGIDDMARLLARNFETFVDTPLKPMV